MVESPGSAGIYEEMLRRDAELDRRRPAQKQPLDTDPLAAALGLDRRRDRGRGPWSRW